MKLEAIEHLIETDEKTCERIAAHHAERKQLKDEAEVIKQQMRDDVARETAKIIADTRAELDRKIAENSAANEASYQKASNRITAMYQEKKEEWCESLLKRITSLDA